MGPSLHSRLPECSANSTVKSYWGRQSAVRQLWLERRTVDCISEQTEKALHSLTRTFCHPSAEFRSLPRTSQEPSEELTVNPPRKKARAVDVGKKGKEKAGPSTEREDSDHAGSLFSGSESDGRSSPDVSLAASGEAGSYPPRSRIKLYVPLGPPRTKRDGPIDASRKGSAPTAGPSRTTPTTQLSQPPAPNKAGPSGIPTKMRLAQAAQSIVPAARPTFQRPNLAKLSFKKNTTNTGSKPNTPVQEAHTSSSAFNDSMAASPVTMDDPSPFFQPPVQQPAAPGPYVALRSALV